MKPWRGMYSKTEVLKSVLLWFSLWLVVFSFGIASIIVVSNSLGSRDGSVSGESGRIQSTIGTSQIGGTVRKAGKLQSGLQSNQNQYQNHRVSSPNSSPSHNISTNHSGSPKVTAEVPNAVLQDVQDTRVQAAMLLGSSLEGGWNAPYPVGDSGTSFGPYQMHQGGLLTSLGLTPAQAENANTATKAMLPTYQAAVNKVSNSLWNSDPEKAAEQAAFIAESPATDYFTTPGSSKVNTNWNQTLNVMGGNATLTSSPLTGALGSLLGISGISNILGLNAGNLRADAERVGLVIFGALLVLVGIVVFALPTAKSTAREAAGLYTAGRVLGVTGGAAKEDRARRSAIAERSLQLGEQKLALKEKREARLDRTATAKMNRGVAE